MKGERREMREALTSVITYPTCTCLACVRVLQWLQQQVALLIKWEKKCLYVKNVPAQYRSSHVIILSHPKWSLFPLCELFLSLKQQAVFPCPLLLHCITNSGMFLLDCGQVQLQRGDSCFTRIWWRPKPPAENTPPPPSPYSVNMYLCILTWGRRGI